MYIIHNSHFKTLKKIGNDAGSGRGFKNTTDKTVGLRRCLAYFTAFAQKIYEKPDSGHFDRGLSHFLLNLAKTWLLGEFSGFGGILRLSPPKRSISPKGEV